MLTRAVCPVLTPVCRVCHLPARPSQAIDSYISTSPCPSRSSTPIRHPIRQRPSNESLRKQPNETAMPLSYQEEGTAVATPSPPRMEARHKGGTPLTVDTATTTPLTAPPSTPRTSHYQTPPEAPVAAVASAAALSGLSHFVLDRPSDLAYLEGLSRYTGDEKNDVDPGGAASYFRHGAALGCYRCVSLSSF